MFKSLLFAVVAMSATAFALPTEMAENAAQDGCNYAGNWVACENGRQEKHDGRRQEAYGERQLQNGNLVGGLANVLGGAITAGAGQGLQNAAGGGRGGYGPPGPGYYGRPY